MSMTIMAYHIDRGPSEMYLVDATAAIGGHPDEWSRTPWTEEMRAAARPKLDEKLAAQKAEQEGGAATPPSPRPKPIGGQTGDGKTDAEIVKRLQGEVDTAKADVGKANAALDSASDAKATAKAQGDLDAANARLAEAQARLDADKK